MADSDYVNLTYGAINAIKKKDLIEENKGKNSC